MLTVELPNGLRVSAVNRADGGVVYHEIFELNSYEKHGVHTRDGDCIFDVGANIGLYSICAATKHDGLSIYAFEPIADVFAALRENAQAHGGNSRIKAFNVGLSDSARTEDFTYDPMATFMSTMRRGDFWSARSKDATLEDILIATLEDARRTGTLPKAAAKAVDIGLASRLLRPGLLLLAGLVFAAVEVRQRVLLPKVRCTLRTASDVIAEHAVERIDLMKIDVEGAEMDVLLGIRDEHWPRIRQLVVEIHDVAGRVDAITSLLRGRGFRTTLDQESLKLHSAFGIFILYAVRD